MATLGVLGSLMSQLGSTQMPQYDPQQVALMQQRLQGGRMGNETALIQLEELKRQQAAEAQVMQAIQQNPALAQQFFGAGPVLGSLQTAPGGPGAAPMTQQTTIPGQPPGAPQVVPGGQDLSQFATQGTPQSTLASLGPPPQGPPQAPQHPLLEMARRDPRAALLLQQRMQQQQDRQSKMEEQRLDIGVKVSEAVARQLQGVTDQASLDEARERIRLIHPQAAAQIPQFYSKEAVEALQQRGIAVADMAKWRKDMASARQTEVTTEHLPKVFGALEQFATGSMGGTTPAPAETTTTAVPPPGGAGNLPQRMNNPYNIKYGKGTRHWVDEGLAEIGETAQDGGQFIKFKDPQVGERAGLELLQGPGYRDLTVDAALKRWSNNGYGAEIVKDIPADTKIKDLSAAQMRPLMAAMRQREGWTAGPSGGPGTAQAPKADPRIAQLQARIDQGNKAALQAEMVGMEGPARQIRAQVAQLEDQRKRLEEPRQKFLEQQAVQDLQLQQKREEGLAAAQVKADTEPAPKEEIDAINRQLPPDKRIPYSTTRKTIRERGLIGGDPVATPIINELTTTTTAIQNFEELSNAVTALPTGPLTQYVEAFKERWGIDISDEKVAQRAILQGATNQLLQARSGAAISEGEYQRLLGELPHAGNDPKVFKARLANTVRQFKNLYKTKVQILRKTGHAIPDDLMEPLAAPEAPLAPKVSTPVDRFREAVKPSR